VREIIVVEGRYDKSAVCSAVDATVVETRGFGVFNDAETVAYLRRLARPRGVIIMTDGDGAGFLIRGKLRGMLGGLDIKDAYIPDIAGRERRKRAGSKEGKLGVEAMRPEAIITALERAGATFDDAPPAPATLKNRERITTLDLYNTGLSGHENSAAKRKALQETLALPARLSAKALASALNAIITREELYRLWGVKFSP
jgi:ribonuclease M5